MGVILYVKSRLQPQRVMLPPIVPSSHYVSLVVCNELFCDPSAMAPVNRSLNIPRTDNMSLISTLETVFCNRSELFVNCHKVNLVAIITPLNTVDS